MADISTELQAILEAVYGEEVRDSIHDAIEKMNSDLTTAIGTQVIDRATVDDILASEALSLKYSNYEEIASATDLNAIAGNPVNYWIPYDKAQTILNIPVKQAGRLFVFPGKGSGNNDDGGVQAFISSQNAGSVGMWVRGWKGQTWTSWKKLSTNDEVTNLNKSVMTLENIAQNGMYTIGSSDIESGGIGTSGGNSSSSTRLRTWMYIPIVSGMQINFYAGTTINQIAIREYNLDFSINSYSSWSSGHYSKTFDHDGFVRFVVRKSDDQELVASDYDANVSIYIDNKSYFRINFDRSLEREKMVSGSIPMYWMPGSLTNAKGADTYTKKAIKTDFIDVHDVNAITILNPSACQYKIYEYTSSKSFIDYVALTTDTKKRHEIGSSVYYLRFVIVDANDITLDFAMGFSAAIDDSYIGEVITEETDRKLNQCESFSGVDVLTWEQGGLYAASGLPYDSSSAIRTGYIPVNGNPSIMINNPGLKTWKVYEYSGTGTSDFIKGSTALSDKDGAITFDSATNYIRLQISGTGTVVSDADAFMLAFPDGYIFKYLESHYAEKKSISILFVGNSLTQDGIAYLPYMLKAYYPEINFKLYMWYNGGKTLKEQYDDYFYPDSACSIFSKAENKASWSNYNNSKTMSSICSTYKFDIVCLQEYFNYKSSYTVSDLTDWNNCRDYIQSHYTGGNALEFISLFHAPLRSSAANVFNMTKLGNALILQKTISQDMIATGIAIYRALSTSLDDLGDSGHLSPDGTHAQEGLPCLLQTYVVLCWVLDKLAIAKSIYGLPFKMTAAIYNTLNVPGANLGTGVIEGTTAQNLLAQEVAILSYKEGKRFVADNIFNDNA